MNMRRVDWGGYWNDPPVPAMTSRVPEISALDLANLRFTYQRGRDWNVVDSFSEERYVLPSLDPWTRFIVDPHCKYYSNSVLFLEDVHGAILTANENLSDEILRIILDLCHPPFFVHNSINSLIQKISVNDDIRTGGVRYDFEHRSEIRNVSGYGPRVWLKYMNT